MKTYWLICKKNTENVNSKMTKTKNGRLQLKSQCLICGNEKVNLEKNKKQKDCYQV